MYILSLVKARGTLLRGLTETIEGLLMELATYGKALGAMSATILGDLLRHLIEDLDPARGGEPHSLTFYILLALGLMIVMYVINRFQYDSTYITVFGESARRRITLAEKLRRLPLAFFAERNLSDLTSTVMEEWKRTTS